MAYNCNYANIGENGILIYAPQPIIAEDGAQIFTTDSAIYEEYGYYKIERISAPSDAPEGQHYEQQGWVLVENHITQNWVLVDDPKPIEEEPTADEVLNELLGVTE